MARRSKRRETNNEARPSVASHVRERHRAIAEREASRLARPAAPSNASIHVSRQKSAVSSTPSGYHRTSSTTETAYCGPFKIARQHVEEQEQAKREQEQETNMNHPLDEAMEELEETRKRKFHPYLSWKPNKNIKKLTTNSIKSLFDICTDFLVANFDDIESLGYLDGPIRTAIANALIAKDKLHGKALWVVAEPGMDILDLSDCSSITEHDLEAIVKKLLAGGLLYLHLDQAGRCVTHKFVKAIHHHKQLLGISIGGAYLLKDEDAVSLVRMAPSSLAFKACPLLGSLTCQSLSHVYQSNHPLIELNLEDLNFSKTDLESLVSRPETFAKAKSVSLKRLRGLDDSILAQLVQHSRQTLEVLDISENYDLTDKSLEEICNHGLRNLQSLNLSGNKQLTMEGLLALFHTVKGQALSPPNLTTLELANLHHMAVSDSVLDLVTATSSQLRVLNIQGSSVVSDEGLEYLTNRSRYSLEKLNVSYCVKLTDQGLGYLVDCCSGLQRLEIWGSAQLTSAFLDGHSRANDASLKIVGTWIKSG